LYDFSENKNFIDTLDIYSDEVKLVTASDDYQDVLKKEDFQWVDCFIVNVFDNFPDNFFRGSEIKVVFTMFTDNSMFNLWLLEELWIEIHNIAWQAAQWVCEFAVSVLLESIKMTSRAQKFSKNGWTGFMDFKWSEIYEKTVGIIGFGSLGQHFSQVMKWFWAEVKYFSKSSQDTQLENIFNNSDIVFVSHPLADSDIPYSIELLQTCKKGTFILNPSRIESFNISDLYDFLRERKDCVFWQDESMTDEWSKWKDRFLELDNFIITPHCGFFTHENPARVEKLTLNNINNYESKK